mgnify:CR=1 FL=1
MAVYQALSSLDRMQLHGRVGHLYSLFRLDTWKERREEGAERKQRLTAAPGAIRVIGYTFFILRG